MVRRIITGLILATVLIPAFAVAPEEQATEAQAGCVFQLGFKTIHDQMADLVGNCTDNEYHNAFNGDGLQDTTGGLLVWRKCDNWTAFTNGSITWVNGPAGIVTRPNEGPTFPFEASNCASAPPQPAPPAPAPGPAATATPVPAAGAPTIDLSLSDNRVDQGEEFTIRLQAEDPDGIESIWWWATSTDDNDLKDTHTRRCNGATPCRESWTVNTQDTGDITIHAQSRDTVGNLSDETTKDITVRELKSTPESTKTTP